MAASRSRSAELRRVWILGLAAVFGVADGILPRVAAAGSSGRDAPLRDAPIVWYADDQRPLDHVPAERDPLLIWDYADAGAFRPLGYYLHPVRNLRRLARPFGVQTEKDAADVNRLGEVLDSSWFTNRIGLFPMSPEEVAAGPNRTHGPSHEGPWTVVGAKTEGVTPGFTVEDVTGARYLIKFDPVELPVISTAAGVISQRLMHAAGYFVPEDEIVHFRRPELVIGEGVEVEYEGAPPRPMVEADLDSILARVEVLPDGRIRALASRFLEGRPLGPFDYLGRRGDDPNDTLDHQWRRSLRGLRVFAEWINHFDSKQGNTLDMLVESDGGRFVRHYLIDFASTLGSGAIGLYPKFGWEATLDPKAFARRWLQLGLVEEDYRRQQRPPYPEIGWFEAEVFSPNGFVPIQRNASFMRMNARDGYWAAKILSAFSDAHLRAAVAQGRYRDPEAARYMVRTLGRRRDRICRYWFDRVPPLDFFRVEGDRLRFRDLGAERGIYPARDASALRYRARVEAVDASRRAAEPSDWIEIARTELDWRDATGPASLPFVHAEVQVNRGRGWSASVHAYVARRSARVVEVRRDVD